MLLRFRREDIEPAAPQNGRKPPQRDTDGRSKCRACGPLALAVEGPESILLLQLNTLSRVKGDESKNGDKPKLRKIIAKPAAVTNCRPLIGWAGIQQSRLQKAVKSIRMEQNRRLACNTYPGLSKEKNSSISRVVQ